MSDGVVITGLMALRFEDDENAWLDFVEEHCDRSDPTRTVRALMIARTHALLATDDETRAEYEASRRPPPKPKPTWRGWRPDAHALLAFAEQRWLPGRTRAIVDLCLRRGFSLAAAARELGVSRETVRTHLRRLRRLARFHGALRDVAPLEWEIGMHGCERGRTPRPHAPIDRRRPDGA